MAFYGFVGVLDLWYFEKNLLFIVLASFAISCRVLLFLYEMVC